MMDDFFTRPWAYQSAITEIEHRSRKNAQDFYSSFGPGSALVVNEIPAGTVNGSNATFTASNNFVVASVAATINGLEQIPGIDFSTSGSNTVIFTQSPETGDIIRLTYVKDSSSSFGPGTGSLVVNEIPTGAVNGSNTTFTASNNFVAGSIAATINGLEQIPGIDFTTSGSDTVIFTQSPETGDIIRLTYVKA
jgi:hypothetical protein